MGFEDEVLKLRKELLAKDEEIYPTNYEEWDEKNSNELDGESNRKWKKAVREYNEKLKELKEKYNIN